MRSGLLRPGFARRRFRRSPGVQLCACEGAAGGAERAESDRLRDAQRRFAEADTNTGPERGEHGCEDQRDVVLEVRLSDAGPTQYSCLRPGGITRLLGSHVSHPPLGWAAAGFGAAPSGGERDRDRRQRRQQQDGRSRRADSGQAPLCGRSHALPERVWGRRASSREAGHQKQCGRDDEEPQDEQRPRHEQQGSRARGADGNQDSLPDGSHALVQRNLDPVHQYGGIRRTARPSEPQDDSRGAHKPQHPDGAAPQPHPSQQSCHPAPPRAGL